jgi:hypothetical protein
MAKAKKTSPELSASQKLSIGVGLTAAAVTAAGAYFLYGSDDAPKNRKKVKGWMLQAKGEVLERLEDAKHMTEDEFQVLVENVIDTYDKAKNLSKKEMKDFRKEMEENWQDLVASGIAKVMTAEQIAKKEASAAKKTVKKKTTKTASKAKKTVKKKVNKTAKKVAKKTEPKKTKKS